MRKMFGAALLGLTVAGGAVIADSAQAQPYGYSYPQPRGYYDNGYYRPAPPAYYNGYSNGYYASPGYSYYGSGSAGLAGALLGSMLGDGGYYQPGVPIDEYGPDPNGMIAPDGHKIKCKLRSGYDAYGRWTRRRECW